MADLYGVTEMYRQRLIRRERKVVRQMLRDWRIIEAELEAQATAIGALIESRAGSEVQAIAFDITTRRAVAPLPDEIPLDWLFKQERVTLLLDQAQQEIEKLAVKYGDLLQDELRGAALDGAQLAARQLRVSTAFATRLSVEAVEFIAAASIAETSPLTALLADVDLPQGLRDALVRGVARGANPRAVAREAARAMNAAKQRTLTIARTEMARAQRQATYDSYRAAGVTQYQWLSAQDASTCAACWAMDGTTFDTFEEIDDHPNGRCAIVPVTEGEPLGEVPNRDRSWAALSESDKMRVLGPSRYDLVSSGQAGIGDLAVIRPANEWGTSIAVKPLSKLTA